MLSFAAAKQLLDDGALQIKYQPFDGHSRSRAGLTDAQIERLNRRLRYVEAIAKGACHLGSKRAIQPVIDAVAAETGDPSPPSASTAASWVHTWLANGCEEAALMPKPKATRRHFAENAELTRIIETSIKKVYLNDQRNTIAAVCADVAIAVAEYNRNKPDVPLKVPCDETVRRHVHRVDLYQRDRARYGKRYAQRVHRAAGIGFFASEPLELTMADGQMMDVIVVEESEGDGPPRPIGRPYLTVILDVFSRCILGAHLSLAPFCGATLLKTLADAAVPNGDRPRGVPGKMIVDNGSDYQSSGFIQACTRLGIELEYSPPRMPNRKSPVERFFRTLNEQLVHKLPGTTFSNPADCGDYRSQDKARLTLAQLRSHVDTWINDHYQVTEHEALTLTPDAQWLKETSNKPVRTISAEEADLLTRRSVERTVVKGCVEAHDLRWGSDALATWEAQERRAGRQPCVEVRLDELDLSYVHVITPGSQGSQFKATARRPQYMKQLSLYEHRLLKAKLKQEAAYTRMLALSDERLYRLRAEYYAALGHADDKVAAACLERLNDNRRRLEAEHLSRQLAQADPSADETHTPVESDAEPGPEEPPPQPTEPDSEPQPTGDRDEAAKPTQTPKAAAEDSSPPNPTTGAGTTGRPLDPRLRIKRRPR